MKKILLMGLPKSGKTTILESIIGVIKHKKGFLTTEVREDNARIGFKIKTSLGREVTFASNKFETPYRVARYYVNVDVLEQLVPDLMSFDSEDLLYIDEIGEMQLYSGNFEKLVRNYLNSPNNFLGTLSQVYSNAFTKEILSRGDVELTRLTAENRQEVYNMLLDRFSCYF